MAWKIKIRMHQDKYQNYPGIPFRIPSKTMDTWGFQQFSIKDELLAKRRPFYEIWSKDHLFMEALQNCRLLVRMV